mgnify:FL=1
MKIYTKTGDNGTTALIGGSRVKKNDIRVEAYGSVDTLNSYMGLLYAECRVKMPPEILKVLRAIENKLFNIGASLANPNAAQTDGVKGLADADIQLLETSIDAMDAVVPPLNQFILPGGAHAAAHAHIARSLCRQAERRIVGVAEAGEFVHPIILNYMNRLSDYLFMLARYINVLTETPEATWNPEA